MQAVYNMKINRLTKSTTVNNKPLSKLPVLNNRASESFDTFSSSKKIESKPLSLVKHSFQFFATPKKKKSEKNYSLSRETIDLLIKDGASTIILGELQLNASKRKSETFNVQRYNELRKYGFSISYAANIAILSESQFTKYKELMEMGISDYLIEDIILFSDNQYASFKNLMSTGFDEFVSARAATLNKNKYSKFEALVNDNIEPAIAIEVAKYNDEQYLRYREFIKSAREENVDNFRAMEVALFKDEQVSKYENLVAKGVNVALSADMVHFVKDDYSNFLLSDKFFVLNSLKRIKENPTYSAEELQKVSIDDEILRIHDSIYKVVTPTQITNQAKVNMLKNFFANNNPKLEKLLTKTDFSKYGKNGIPLAYTREEFLFDLSSLLRNTAEWERKKIFSKLDIEPIEAKNGQITGYNGIIDLTKSGDSEAEKQVYSLANKFIQENEVVTGNEELDLALNSLIQGLPEFINIIGKHQHKTHDLSLDCHILTVLKEAMSDPQFKKLSDKDKFCLKFSIILHDFAKAENVIDTNHEANSALYAKDILNKSNLNLPAEYKDRIFEFIENHNWLQKYNSGKASAEEIAVEFRRTGSFTAAQIFAAADLKGVKTDKSFYKKYGETLQLSKKPIEQALQKINSNGQIILTNSIINKSKVPIANYKGNDYKVIDFSKLYGAFDLSKYGFEKGTTVENLRLLVHSTRRINDIENVFALGSTVMKSLLCASYISVDSKETFSALKYGLSLRPENCNIANATEYNQGSGGHKGYDNFSSILQEDFDRTLIPDSIKSTLSLNDKEYAKLYSQIQQYTHLTQFDNIEPIKIGHKTISGKKIKNAIILANSLLLSNQIDNNEVNLYSAKTNAVTAKVNSLDEIPPAILKFAKEHDLPIFLLGE